MIPAFAVTAMGPLSIFLEIVSRDVPLLTFDKSLNNEFIKQTRLEFMILLACVVHGTKGLNNTFPVSDLNSTGL
jgi:hypothetical protein